MKLNHRAVLFPRISIFSAVLLAACSTTPPVPVSSPPARNTSPPGGGVPQTMPSQPSKNGGFYKDDGPGDKPPSDMASIPDAQPKLEPLHAWANRPYEALGQAYTPRQQLAPYKVRGLASWYGRRFHGKKTSNGEFYDMYAMTAAHPTLPLPSYVRVTNVENQRSVVVRLNDRGPFHRDRVIDLSYTAAWKLGYVSKGSTMVEVEALLPDTFTAPPLPPQAAPAPVSASVTEPSVVVGVSEPVRSVGASWLQLGAFTTQANAEAFREYVQGLFPKLQEGWVIAEDAGRFRLQLGPYPAASDARSAAEQMAARLKFKPFVVQR